MPVRLLLADDSDTVRRAICYVISTQPEIELVGEATDFAQAIQLTNDLKPDVIVMDLHMPDEANIDSVDVKSLLNHGSRILAVSMWNDADAKALAHNLGAVTLLDKADLGMRLVPTIMKLATNVAELSN